MKSQIKIYLFHILSILFTIFNQVLLHLSLQAFNFMTSDSWFNCQEYLSVIPRFSISLSGSNLKNIQIFSLVVEKCTMQLVTISTRISIGWSILQHSSYSQKLGSYKKNLNRRRAMISKFLECCHWLNNGFKTTTLMLNSNILNGINEQPNNDKTPELLIQISKYIQLKNKCA